MRRVHSLVWAAVLALLAGRGGGGGGASASTPAADPAAAPSTPPLPPVSTPAPTAVAGQDVSTTTGSTLTLDASKSSGSSTLSHSWALTQRPQGSEATFTLADSATPQLFLDVVGNFTSTVTVTDSTGQSSTTDISITAQPAFKEVVIEAEKAFLHAVGDFNGDGRTDLIMVIASGSPFVPSTVFLYTQDASGNLTRSMQVATGSVFVAGVGDVNGDGRADLILDRLDGSCSVDVLLGKQDSTFEAPRNAPLATCAPPLLSVVDFNGTASSISSPRAGMQRC